VKLQYKNFVVKPFLLFILIGFVLVVSGCGGGQPPHTPSWTATDLESSLRFYGIWGTSASNVYALEVNWKIYRFNGSSWSLWREEVDPPYDTYSAWSLWVSPDDKVFMGGSNNTDSSVIVYFNGTGWIYYPLPDAGYALAEKAIWGTDYNNVYAVATDNTNSKIYHFDGTDWTCIHTENSRILYHIWGLAAENIYACGASYILHYNGTWNDISPDGSRLYEGVWGTAANNLLAFGGDFYGKYNGSEWTINALSNMDIYGVWGSGTGHPVFGVGAYQWPATTNNIFKYDGGWNVVTNTPSSTQVLYAIWGPSNSEFFACGSGTLLHYK
jgi:hypothetical protein